MKKVIGLNEYRNFREEIIEFALLLAKHPKADIKFNKNYRDCYYENDDPSYELIIDGFENDD